MKCVCGRDECAARNRAAFPAARSVDVRARVRLTGAPWSRRRFWSWYPVLNGRPLNFLVWREGHYDSLPQAWAAAARYTQGADL